MESKISDSIQYCLTHGIVYGLRASTVNGITPSCGAVHAPFTLQPYQFPSPPFEQAKELAPVINILVDKISRNPKWLKAVLHNTAANDEFTGKLMRIFDRVLEEGVQQPIQLGIIRSDYMLHAVEGDPRALLQVEINTISSSFGALSSVLVDMYSTTNRGQADLKIPANAALEGIVDSFALVHRRYLCSSSCIESDEADAVVVLMVVQPNERNFADQRMLEFELWRRHKIVLKRATFADVHEYCKLDDNTRELYFKHSRVSLVYFRAGYTPTDYPSEREWDSRLLLERSRAVKCPSIGLHLAGCKKVQQVLANPNVLERDLGVPFDMAQQLRRVFAGLYNLDPDECRGDPDALAALEKTKKRAISEPHKFVVKPQREGGGNNIYGEQVAEALQTMSNEELSAYILMERIFPPQQTAVLVREGSHHEEICLCELGIFGIFISGGTEVPSESPIRLDEPNNVNCYSGYILRVKPATSDEGGVAAGYSVLSSPCLGY